MSNEVKSDSGLGPVAGASGGYSISSLIASGFSKYGLILALILLIVFLSITAENFFTVSNMMNILLQSANIGIMAAGPHARHHLRGDRPLGRFHPVDGRGGRRPAA